MNWIIIIGISIISTFIVVIIFRFFMELNKDNNDLKGQTLSEKFKLVVDIINQSSFDGLGKVILLHKRGFNLHKDGENQIIQFEYSTGHLTIIWRYKYFNQEVTHEKTFRDVRILSLYDQQNIAEEMINEMTIVVEKHKRNVLGSHSMEGMVDFHKGVAKYNRQDYLGAIADYTKAIELDPTNTMASITYYSRGITKSKLLDHPGAIADYSKTIELDPSDSNAYFSRGKAKYDLNDYDGAIEDFSKTIELNPEFAEAYYSRGLARIKLGQKEGGYIDLSKACELGFEEAYEVINKNDLLAPQVIVPVLVNVIDHLPVINTNIVSLKDAQLSEFPFFKDPQDGYIYKTVKIGDQIWLAENLNTEVFSNGNPIVYARDDWEWKKAGDECKPAWCFYDNTAYNRKDYGSLYNWYAVVHPSGLAPLGWHIPTDKEWMQLIEYLGIDDCISKMKSSYGWEYNSNGTNISGFSALPAGSRSLNGGFSDLGKHGSWWSTTEHIDWAWVLPLAINSIKNGRNFIPKSAGCPVRCVKDI